MRDEVCQSSAFLHVQQRQVNYVAVPVQFHSLAHFDSRQFRPGLIWRWSNWAKESHYGQDHKTIEQNEFYDSMSLS